MDLGIADRSFLVTGASSGLGRAVAERLLAEKAKVIVVARNLSGLDLLSNQHPGQVISITGDVRDENLLSSLASLSFSQNIDGIFVNAGGPPAKTVAETTLQDWDDAYGLLVRWKVDLIKQLLPLFQQKKYGRIVFSESVSVKQPVDNLVLSNSFRMAIVGFAKTLAQEYAKSGITANTMGPGFHDTAALERLFRKKSEQEGIDIEQARVQSLEKIPVGAMGKPEDFASLAAWLLSPLSAFVTGQVFFLEGGTLKSSL
jgi:3-oxoacyl-[acyl-carrier protein] reductase